MNNLLPYMDKLKDNNPQMRQTPESPEIKVTLRDRGLKDNHTAKIFKAPENSPAVLPVKMIPKKSRILNSPFIIPTLIVIVLMCAAVLLWWFLTQGEPQNPTPAPPQTTPQPQAVSPESLVAFAKYRDASSSAFALYDITKEREVVIADPLAAEHDALVALGPWSPDGRYLPILVIRDSTVPNPLYWYDTLEGQARQIVDAHVKPDLLSGVASFDYLSRWLQNDILVFNLRAAPEINTDELIVVNARGEVSKVSRPSKVIRGNRNLEVSLALSIEATPSAIERQIRLDGKDITFNLRGEVIGVTDGILVTLESPEIPQLASYSDNRSLIAALEAAETENEAERLLEEALQPTGEWQLHFYQANDGSLVNSLSLGSDGWLTIQAQIRPNQGTVIVSQQDKLFSPFTSRYVEIDLKKGVDRRVVAEGRGEAGEVAGDSFFLTRDGNWLIGYAPSEDPQAYPLGKTIVAWQIDSGVKKLLCEDRCDQVRVYNPHSLQLR